LLYLLDANTLINAKDQYYSFDIVPEYWEWLVFQGSQHNIKIPSEIYSEINGANQNKRDRDELAHWSRREEVKAHLLLEGEVDAVLVNQVIIEGYLPDPSEADLVKMGRDPFLIAYGLQDRDKVTIVTTEASKPSKKGANRHIPDICNHFGIHSCNTFQMIRTLGFSTNWQASR
jgi:hypothetical protein